MKSNENENADQLAAAGAETGHTDDESSVSDAGKLTQPRQDGKPYPWRSHLIVQVVAKTAPLPSTPVIVRCRIMQAQYGGVLRRNPILFIQHVSVFGLN